MAVGDIDVRSSWGFRLLCSLLLSLPVSSCLSFFSVTSSCLSVAFLSSCLFCRQGFSFFFSFLVLFSRHLLGRIFGRILGRLFCRFLYLLVCRFLSRFFLSSHLFCLDFSFFFRFLGFFSRCFCCRLLGCLLVRLFDHVLCRLFFFFFVSFCYFSSFLSLFCRFFGLLLSLSFSLFLSYLIFFGILVSSFGCFFVSATPGLYTNLLVGGGKKISLKLLNKISNYR